MKISLASSSRRAGALILTLVIIGFVALSLSTYFLLTQGEYFSVQRSQVWNSAIVMAEAGVEDALALINKNQRQFGALSTWTATAAADNWDTANQPLYQGVYNWPVTNGIIYHVRRSPDTNTGYYDVYVNSGLSGTNNGPAIVSIGTVYWNIAGPGGGGSSNGFTVSYTGNPVRKIFVQTKLDALINGNLVSVTNTTFNGNGVTIDSFDSSDPHHSDWQLVWTYHGQNYGTYPASPMAASGDPDPTEPYMRKDNAQVATDGQLITVQNANVAGYINTGPGGSPSENSGGYVGDVAWVFAAGGTSPGNATQAVEPGHARDDMNTIFPDVSLPDAYTNSANYKPIVESGSSTSVFTNYGNLQTNYYQLTTSSHGGTGLCNNPIDIQGTNIVIWVPYGINYVGSSTKQLTLEANSDVKIYLDVQLNTGGNAGINNSNRYAPAFAIYGLPSCATISLGGNGAITAYVYAPEASLSLGGGGSTTYDSVGAFIVRDISFGGHVNFHFDEQLLKLGPQRGYIPAVWQEVP
jgi:hypothetical protein